MSRWLALLIVSAVTALMSYGVFNEFMKSGPYVSLENVAFICKRHETNKDWLVCVHENSEEFTLLDPAILYRYVPPPNPDRHERPRARARTI